MTVADYDYGVTQCHLYIALVWLWLYATVNYKAILFFRLFVQPMYDSVLLEQSMIYNRRKDEFNLRDRLAIIDSEEERNILPDEGKADWSHCL